MRVIKVHNCISCPLLDGLPDTKGSKFLICREAKRHIPLEVKELDDLDFISDWCPLEKGK